MIIDETHESKFQTNHFIRGWNATDSSEMSDAERTIIQFLNSQSKRCNEEAMQVEARECESGLQSGNTLKKDESDDESGRRAMCICDQSTNVSQHGDWWGTNAEEYRY